MSGRTYSLAPLATAMGFTEATAIRALGIGGTRAKRLRTVGLPVELADRFATRAGFHPSEVWPTWATDAIDDASKACAECGTPFIPANTLALYCGARCRKRAQQRRYRQRPEAAERSRQKRRAYYAEAAEYERARQRRYTAEHRDEINARRRRQRAA